ncbi:hypothetical protein [Paenibacillus piri]|uniref:Uncharacterized protein n=1 Tax=Paenibacillus piri TaxID=2547395 RepID=A0A4V2ZTY5_9BACL|nr:hypothetical protein [Paenibacillus piri]TDF98924.1 hypothetical protein E1757_10480 [Paenibacillus piri]
MATTNSKHDLPVHDNVLNQEFTANKPNEKWVTDMTREEAQKNNERAHSSIQYSTPAEFEHKVDGAWCIFCECAELASNSSQLPQEYNRWPRSVNGQISLFVICLIFTSVTF